MFCRSLVVVAITTICSRIPDKLEGRPYKLATNSLTLTWDIQELELTKSNSNSIKQFIACDGFCVLLHNLGKKKCKYMIIFIIPKDSCNHYFIVCRETKIITSLYKRLIHTQRHGKGISKCKSDASLNSTSCMRWKRKKTKMWPQID